MAEDESPPSASSATSPSAASVSDCFSGELSRIVGKGSCPFNCLDRIFCRIRDGEKSWFFGAGGARNSETVDCTAVAISALDVYGKQMFNTALFSS